MIDSSLVGDGNDTLSIISSMYLPRQFFTRPHLFLGLILNLLLIWSKIWLSVRTFPFHARVQCGALSASFTLRLT